MADPTIAAMMPHSFPLPAPQANFYSRPFYEQALTLKFVQAYPQSKWSALTRRWAALAADLKEFEGRDISNDIDALYVGVYQEVMALRVNAVDFATIHHQLNDAIGNLYLALFHRVADVHYLQVTERGAKIQRTDAHHTSVSGTYQHALIVTANVEQLHAISQRNNPPEEEKGFGLLVKRHETKSAKSFDDMRALLSSVQGLTPDESIDLLLQAALLHDIAKYKEDLLDPTRGHEVYAHELIRDEQLPVSPIASEICRLHLHFGIVYNGEFSPTMLIDEIKQFHERGVSKQDIHNIMTLTALFTLADVTAYGPITNTMVAKVTEMMMEENGLAHVIEAIDDPNQFEARSRTFIDHYAKEMLIGQVRFGNTTVDDYPEGTTDKMIVNAQENVISNTDSIVSQRDWTEMISTMIGIRFLRYINYLIKALRLRSVPAAVNFTRLVLKVAALTGQIEIRFVNAQGQPINGRMDLATLLAKFAVKMADATDVHTNDQQHYYFIDSTGHAIPDSPLLFVRHVHAEKTLVVRFPFLISSDASETLAKGGTIILTDDMRNTFLSHTSPDFFGPYGINIPMDPVNLYQSTFNPVMTLMIAQAFCNVYRPSSVVLAGDNSFWAEEHIRLLASVFAGNNVPVTIYAGATPIGVVAGEAFRDPKNQPEFVIYVNQGAGRNFGFGIYTNFGALSPDVLRELYTRPLGVEAFLKGDTRTIRVGIPPLPQLFVGLLPTIEFPHIGNIRLWFKNADILNTMASSFAAAYGHAWRSLINISVVQPNRSWSIFDDVRYLTHSPSEISMALYNVLLRREEETTHVFLNSNGSRMGLAETVPKEVGLQMQKMGAIIVGGNDTHDVIHYPFFLISTLIACLYALEFSASRTRHAFRNSVLTTSNIRRIAHAFNMDSILTNVSEAALNAGFFPLLEDTGAHVLFSAEVNSGTGLIVNKDHQRRHIERQNNPFSLAMHLFHARFLLNGMNTFAELLISVQEQYRIPFFLHEQLSVPLKGNDDCFNRLKSLNVDDVWFRIKVEEVSNSYESVRQIIFEDGSFIAFYESYKKGSNGPTIRLFIDAPDAHTIERILSQLNLVGVDRAVALDHNPADNRDRALRSA